MFAQLAALVCAAAMALSLGIEAGSFFHSPLSVVAKDDPDGPATTPNASEAR